MINLYENDYGYDPNQWYEEFAATVDNSDPTMFLTYIGVQTSSKTIDDLGEHLRGFTEGLFSDLVTMTYRFISIQLQA